MTDQTPKEISSEELELIEKFRTMLRAYDIGNPNKQVESCVLTRTPSGSISYDIKFREEVPEIIT